MAAWLGWYVINIVGALGFFVAWTNSTWGVPKQFPWLESAFVTNLNSTDYQFAVTVTMLWIVFGLFVVPIAITAVKLLGAGSEI